MPNPKDRPTALMAPFFTATVRKKYKPEIITQDALKKAFGAQWAAWWSSSIAHKECLEIQAAIERGAQIEAGEYSFHRDVVCVAGPLYGIITNSQAT